MSSDGASYITGEFWEPIRFGSTQLTVTGGYAAFVAKYDEDGDVVWARQSSGQGIDSYAIGFSVATIDDGSVYVAGEFGGSVTLSTKPLEGEGESGFLAKYRANGSVNWITTGTTLCGAPARRKGLPVPPGLEAALGKLGGAWQRSEHGGGGLGEFIQRFEQASGRREPIDHLGVGQRRDRKLQRRLHLATKMADSQCFFGSVAIAFRTTTGGHGWFELHLA